MRPHLTKTAGALGGGIALLMGSFFLLPLRPLSPEESGTKTIRDSNPDNFENEVQEASEAQPFPVRLIKAPSKQPSSLEEADGGEILEYQIFLDRVPAGKALMRVTERSHWPDSKGYDCWRVRLDIRSSRALAALYPVQDKIISIIDVKSGCSRFCSMDKREGDYQLMEKVRFDYRLNSMTANYYRMHRPSGQYRNYATVPLAGVTLPGVQKVLDPLSACYYLRCRSDLSMKNAQGITIPIFADRKLWQTRIFPQSRELKRVAGLPDKQWCLNVVPECKFNGLFQRRSKIKLWLHEATRIPVEMHVWIPVGECHVILINHKNSPLDEFAK